MDNTAANRRALANAFRKLVASGRKQLGLRALQDASRFAVTNPAHSQQRFLQAEFHLPYAQEIDRRAWLDGRVL